MSTGSVHIVFSETPGVTAGHVAVRGITLPVDLSKVEGGEFAMDPKVRAVIWDGCDGQIQRASRVPGKIDVEHFEDRAILDPYIAVWQVEFDAREAAAAAQKVIDDKINADLRAESERMTAAAAEAEKVAGEVSQIEPL